MVRWRRVAVVFGAVVTAFVMAVPVSASGGVETYPATPDEAFYCYFDGIERNYTTEAETVDGFIRLFTDGGGFFSSAMILRVYDGVEYRLDADDAAERIPYVVYVTGRQTVRLTWSTPQPVGEEPDDPATAMFSVPRMEIRDAEGNLADVFRYLALVDADGLDVIHQSGVCGDFVDG